ncbi:MAG: sulfur oxidation c-type cytochrome SoxX [Pseudomonadota bacterium]
MKSTAFIFLSCLLMAPLAAEEAYLPWRVDNFAITQPLGGLRGDAARGREIVASRERGNCISCHLLPIPEHPRHGTLAPPLFGVGARLSAGELRLRVVDEKLINPATIMPAFYRDPARYNRPHPDYATTILSAQEVEDVVAYLVTLR